jgi:hypothetical protein
MVREYVRARGCLYASFVALLLCVVMAVPTMAKTVFVEAVGGFDAALVNEARPYLAAWVESTGHQLTSVRDGAAYRARLVITEAQASRPFNWWVLLFPLWPIIPVTTVEANVVVSLTVVDASGHEIYENTAGGEASAFLFADFLSKKSVKVDAFEEAFRRVIVSAYLP